MLTISAIGSSTGQVNYFVSLGKEDYYTADDEAPAVWWGYGAHQLGLTGRVNSEAFRNILLGVSPNGSRHLVQNARKQERRAGFDLCFSAPKSVATLFAVASLGDRARIVEVSERALAKTLHTVERLLGQSRRGRLGAVTERAGLVGIVCRHETSRGIPGRVPDPNLHWHVVLCNVSVREDGSTGAFDGRRLFERHMKMCLGALYRAELSKQIEAEFGLRSHRPSRPNGARASWFELSDVPKALLGEFSKRREEIEKWMKLRGVRGGKAAEAAALATRRSKEEFPREKLFAEWNTAGAEHGFTPVEVARLLSAHSPTRDVARESAESVEAAIKRITDDRAHFTEIELIRYVGEEAQCRGIGIAEIQCEVSRKLSDDEIVRLGRDNRGTLHYSTKEMLRVEASMLAGVDSGKCDTRHVLSSPQISAVLRQFSTISPEQREAVRFVTVEPGSVKIVNGWAGAGKTFMMKVAHEAFKSAGKRVLGTALSANAAKNLERESGIESTHLDRLFWELDNGKRSLRRTDLIVVDEAGRERPLTQPTFFSVVQCLTVNLPMCKRLEPGTILGSTPTLSQAENPSFILPVS